MTQANLLIQVALPTPLRRVFDYLPPVGFTPKQLIVGARVSVPFQSRELIGIITGLTETSDVPKSKLKQAMAILDEAPLLSQDVYELCVWAADYYHYPIGEVFQAAIPAILRQDKPLLEVTLTAHTTECEAPLMLNEAQQKAFRVMSASNQFDVFLLDGVTGSGKTEVYLQAIQKVLSAGKQVLVLVPEINLTPQTIARFERRFAVPLVTLHSNLTDKTRLKAWCAAKKGEAKIVIGTRSAVFTSFKHLGLIVIDEEHDASFKQQDRFRYHARDLAIMRAKSLNIPIILGSATPSLESLHNANHGRYHYLSLPNRAGGAALPTIKLINMRAEKSSDGLSETLLTAIKSELAANNQVMVFLNRRGFAPVYFCLSCQHMIECKRCSARMVYHDHPKYLHCHHCDAKTSLPKSCVTCANQTFEPVGLGTQRLEQVLSEIFKTYPIIRVDRDSTRKKGDFDAILADIHTGKPAILLGTQMLAKGHHFPNVTLVAVIDIDAGLLSADFRAAEQTGQLVLQVAGRAGREEKKGVVMIQTHHPDNQLLQTLIRSGYSAYAALLLKEREEALLPPFSYFALVKAESYKEDHAHQFLDGVRQACGQTGVSLYGPVPALLSKKKGLYVKHLLVKSAKRSALKSYLYGLLNHVEGEKGQSVKWLVDVDPVEVI